MGLVLLPPVNPDLYADPLLLADAKAQCRVFIDFDDALITDLVKTAGDHFETITGLSLITKRWELTLCSFCSHIYLPKSPLVAIESIKYLDIDNVEQTLAGASYQVNTTVQPGYVTLIPTASWPSLGTLLNPVRIIFTAGYGNEPKNVPVGIRTALKMLVAHWYQNRELTVDGSLMEVPMSFKSLFWAHRVTVPV